MGTGYDSALHGEQMSPSSPNKRPRDNELGMHDEADEDWPRASRREGWVGVSWRCLCLPA